MNVTPFLEAKGLTKRFHGLQAIDNISFELRQGEMLGLIGPNGAGKTTLVSLISGTLTADGGSLFFEGKRIDHLPPYERAHLGIGRTFQVMKPFPRLTVLENVAVGALFGLNGGVRDLKEARAQARALLEFTGLAHRADQQGDQLGGPDRKRLELAKALALRPKLLLLDEVMAGLNPSEIDEVVAIVKKIRDGGTSILVIEHVMRAIRSLSDRIIVLHHGEMLAQGEPNAILADPRVIDAYLGEAARMSEVLLSVKDLRAGYGAAPVLFDIGFEVTRGEIVALVGSNGAGKTTLLRAISRLIDAQGAINFAGHDLMALAPEQVFALGLVQVPEGRQLFPRMSVEENLLMGGSRRPQADLAGSFERVYQIFPILGERRKQWAGDLSGGEQQMCALARALMADPKLLVVDEMSLGLAPVIVDQLLTVLADIRKSGVTVLLVEQDVFAAFSVADRGYVLETGRIVHQGRVADLERDPALQKAYLGVA